MIYEITRFYCQPEMFRIVVVYVLNNFYCIRFVLCTILFDLFYCALWCDTTHTALTGAISFQFSIFYTVRYISTCFTWFLNDRVISMVTYRAICRFLKSDMGAVNSCNKVELIQEHTRHTCDSVITHFGIQMEHKSLNLLSTVGSLASIPQRLYTAVTNISLGSLARCL